MPRLNRNVSKLVTTTVVFSAAACGCLYLAWQGPAAARPLWAMIAALVAVLGGLLFELYRGRRG